MKRKGTNWKEKDDLNFSLNAEGSAAAHGACVMHTLLGHVYLFSVGFSAVTAAQSKLMKKPPFTKILRG